MNTPPRQTQSTGQPAQVGFQTPPRRIRPEFAEPPPVVRMPNKKRRGADLPVRNLGIMFNNINLE